MKEVFICYKTDNWHSYSSRDIIGIGTSVNEAFIICNTQSRKENQEFSEDDVFLLREKNQTQGYNGEGEFQIEPVNTNVLL